MASTAEVSTNKKVHSLHHVNVPVSNRDQTEEWYGKVFGMKLVTPPGDPNYRAPNPKGLYLTSPDGNFDLHFNVVGDDKEKIAGVATSMHFAFEVEDWDGFLVHLDELGIDYKLRDSSASARNAGFAGKSITTSFRDPDGYVIEVMYHYNRSW